MTGNTPQGGRDTGRGRERASNKKKDKNRGEKRKRVKDEDEQNAKKERRMIKGMGEEGERKEGKDQNSDAHTMTGDKSHFVSTQ